MCQHRGWGVGEHCLRLTLTVPPLHLRNIPVSMTKVALINKPSSVRILWSRGQVIILFVTSVPLFWELSVVRENHLKTTTIYGKEKRNYEYICSINYIHIKELFFDFSIHGH